jgi:ABC-type uncharacterized transport system permease subunit
MRKERKQFLSIMNNIKKMQAHIKGFIQVKKYIKESICTALVNWVIVYAHNKAVEKKVLIIQKHCRCYNLRK